MILLQSLKKYASFVNKEWHYYYTLWGMPAHMSLLSTQMSQTLSKWTHLIDFHHDIRGLTHFQMKDR